MIWKVIGSSIIGSSHLEASKNCEDSITFERIIFSDKTESLICCISDGAGSAKFGGYASNLVTAEIVRRLAEKVRQNLNLEEINLYEILETVYDILAKAATKQEVPLNEFSCTCLACILLENKALFFQIGDGAIIRADEYGAYTIIFWPENGEYSNTTSFLIDDSNFPSLRYKLLEEPIQEVAMFTDGLQMLVLNFETTSVYAPFFDNLFQWLRRAATEENLHALNKKLEDYLQSDLINAKTNDDKTLFLATRTIHDSSNV